MATPKGRAAALTIALLAASMLALTVALRVAKRGELLAHRVVVGASGCGPVCSEMLALALAESLRGLGFDAAVPDTKDREPFSSPQAARAFAREHGARSAVMVALAIENSAALAGGGARVSADATLYVMDAARRDAPRQLLALRGVEDADDEREALVLVARHALQGLFAPAADALLTTHAVMRLPADATGLEQQAAALSLGKQQHALQARRAAMREYAQQCAANSAELARADRGRCVSAGCAREYAVAMLPDASAAVVHDSGELATFPLEPNATPRALSTAERLWLVPRTGPRTLLAEAADFEARPDLSRDGRVLAFVEQRPGHSALYALSLATRERRLIATAVAPKRVTSPRVSADGTRVLYYVRDAKHDRSALRMARSADDAPARTLLPDAIDARWVALAPAHDTAKRLWIAALVRDAAPRNDAPPGDALRVDSELLWIDADTGSVFERQALRAHSVRAIGDFDGEGLLLSWQDESCGFARARLGHAIEWITTALCPKYIAVGKSGVFAHVRIDDTPPTRQLVRLDTTSGELRLMTQGTLDAQTPHPAADADGLVYERVFPRKYGDLQHIAVCFDDQRERERAGSRNAAASSSESNVSAVCRESSGRNKACH